MKLPQPSLDWSIFSGSNVTIINSSTVQNNALGEPILTTAVVYHGPANVFDAGGTIINDVLGSIAQEVLKVIIDGTPGTLPATNVGDGLTIDGDPSNSRYLIQHAHYWDTFPYCLELDCNRGKG